MRILKIEEEESASTYYDLTVTAAGNYWADGAWHHNSGKTRALAEDITNHIWQNAGAKAIVARQTEVSQADSSIETFLQYFESQGDQYRPALGLFKLWNNGRTIRLPSALAVERMQKECKGMTSRAEIALWIQRIGDPLCGYIEFRGLPDADKGKFRGMECSYFAMVEADQILKKQFSLSLACLRWKGADPATCDEKGFIKDRCVVLDSNPPSETHWIAEMEAEQAAMPENERTMRFWHLSTYENEHNLPENYIRDTILTPYANNPAMIERMLYGRYADAYDGKPVYYAYRRNQHEQDDLGWPMGATLTVGMDVGTNNASIISAFKEYKQRLYWWCLKEIILTGSDTDRQCIELLKVLANEFPFWNQGGDVCPQTLFFCDPAARNSAFTKAGPTSSALKVMQSHGIFPGMKTAAHLQPTFATVNRLLQQHHSENGRRIWHFKIDPKGCPNLARGMRGGYRYSTKDEPGYGSDLPLKGSLCDHLDHICFVAGTKVTTKRGDIPIEQVMPGDMALTRQGWRKVTKSGTTRVSADTWELRAGNITVNGTADHPIWTDGGWKKLATILAGDRITVCRTSQSFSTEKNTEKTQHQAARTAVHTHAMSEDNHSTAPCGSTPTDQFQKDTTSTIRTGRNGTTRSTTSNFLRPAITQKSTGPDDVSCSAHACSAGKNSKQEAPREQALSFAATDARPTAGESRRSISLQDLASFAENRSTGVGTNLESADAQPALARNTSHPSTEAPDPALTVDRNSPLASMPGNKSNSAQSGAKRRIERETGKTTSQRSAASAEPNSPETVTIISGIAVESAPIKQSGRHVVYNLTVEGAHEYFANGILVSNCDAHRYSVINVIDIAEENHTKAMTSKTPPITNPEPARRI